MIEKTCTISMKVKVTIPEISEDVSEGLNGNVEQAQFLMDEIKKDTEKLRQFIKSFAIVKAYYKMENKIESERNYFDVLENEAKDKDINTFQVEKQLNHTLNQIIENVSTKLINFEVNIENEDFIDKYNENAKNS
ncbi:hypothetical protein [Natranaerofaba carboxydovora]|uniref:hypothetical protein n=1 Tax=Natranaerofaba carboxydovora TaxID=2742683 RepID=UPI001F137532|nr:hypothetical protein [Natranaerofaba carboxydovora]UMZ73558.1 hypothetical protein ACONDI_01112 [Natranaerofaba carboxydovora]